MTAFWPSRCRECPVPRATVSISSLIPTVPGSHVGPAAIPPCRQRPVHGATPLHWIAVRRMVERRALIPGPNGSYMEPL